jgi:hypothetical protein
MLMMRLEMPEFGGKQGKTYTQDLISFAAAVKSVHCSTQG